MIDFNIRVDINRPGMRKSVNERLQKAQIALDNQVIKDSNFYAPEDVGTLQQSAIVYSKPGSGSVVWNTPYARRLYYNPQYNFSKDKNRHARGLWFEEAKAVKKGTWQRVAQNAFNKG